ncbi:MAG: hypothetical protein H7333_04230 [Bdellovibrionales bacterium]|nr:hypothetical protein [Oligoflexia bacterium]
MMQTTPWHERDSTIEEEHRFKRLLSLHALTQCWTQVLDNTDSNLIERMPKITLNQNLWLLEKARVDEITLELSALVGSQNIQEFLKELEETIWLIQISTLENAFSQTSDPALLKNLLKNASWSQGKKTAEQDWPNLPFTTLTDAYQAFTESHVNGKSGFLLGSAANQELGFYWKKSPIQNPSLNRSAQLEMLCELHSEWVHGFFYGLSRVIRCISQTVKAESDSWIEFTLLLTY